MKEKRNSHGENEKFVLKISVRKNWLKSRGRYRRRWEDILKWILEKQDVMLLSAFNWIRIGSNAGHL